MREEQKKMCKILTVSFFTLQNQTTLPIIARCIVTPIYWRRNTYLSFFCTFLYLSISIPSSISVSPSLNLSPYIHLPCYLHLPHHLYLPLYRSKRKIIPKGEVHQTNRRILLIDRNIRLLILLYFAEGKYTELKTTAKFYDKRTSIAMVQGR